MVIAKGPKVGRLFPSHLFIPYFSSFACTTVQNKGEIWHKHLSHLNFIVLSYLVNSSLLGDKNQSSSHDVLFGYSTCKFHKSKILPFIPLDNRSIKCFDIIHNDVWGITLIISHAHYKYFMRFIGDYNWFTYMYFLHSKFEVFFILKTFFFLY